MRLGTQPIFKHDSQLGVSCPDLPLISQILLGGRSDWTLTPSSFGAHYGFEFQNGFVGFQVTIAPVDGRYLLTVVFVDVEDRHSYTKVQRVNNHENAFRQALAHILKTQRDEGI